MLLTTGHISQAKVSQLSWSMLTQVLCTQQLVGFCAFVFKNIFCSLYHLFIASHWTCYTCYYNLLYIITRCTAQTLWTETVDKEALQGWAICSCWDRTYQPSWCSAWWTGDECTNAKTAYCFVRVHQQYVIQPQPYVPKHIIGAAERTGQHKEAPWLLAWASLAGKGKQYCFGRCWGLHNVHKVKRQLGFS